MRAYDETSDVSKSDAIPFVYDLVRPLLKLGLISEGESADVKRSLIRMKLR